jgi:hypothetical protein
MTRSTLPLIHAVRGLMLLPLLALALPGQDGASPNRGPGELLHKPLVRRTPVAEIW